MKATCIAPSNIAFIKYWGKKDEALRLPENGSLSMNLSNLLTTTTVEFSSQFTEDYIEIDGEQEPNEGSRAIIHLDRIRKLANLNQKAKVVTKNNFPRGTGLSASASGFAALTLAATKAAGLNLSEKDISILARQGSGSACRSIPSGFVEWLDGDTSDTSYATSLYSPDYWDIVDIVCIVSEEEKDVPTSEGQRLTDTSPFFPVRQDHMKNKIERIKKYMSQKDFKAFGELVEAEALELHAIMLTSRPSLIYWTCGTLQLMKLTKKWRAKGLPVYFTINTGQNIHLICEGKNAEAVKLNLKEVPEVKSVIINTPAIGAHLISAHLF